MHLLGVQTRCTIITLSFLNHFLAGFRIVICAVLLNSKLIQNTRIPISDHILHSLVKQIMISKVT